MTSEKMTFGQRLEKAVNDAGGLAVAARVTAKSVKQLRRYIAEESEPPTSVIAKLCEAASIRPEWLLTGQTRLAPLDELARFKAAAGGLSGEPYRHQPGSPVPVEPPAPPAVPVVNDDLLVDLYHRVAALYLSERLPSSIEGELRNALALYNELVEKHGPSGPPPAAISDRIAAFRGWLRKHRDEILKGDG